MLLSALPVHAAWRAAARRAEVSALSRQQAVLFPPPPIMASSAALLDADTGQWLYLKNPDQQRAMASTTKIMTALLAIQSGNLNRLVRVSKAAAQIGCTCMGLSAGERVPLIELLYGLLLPSGNDAAMTIADGVAGSQQAFVAMMNAEAIHLGMVNTHYVTPHGLDEPGHYSSARDLALLARVASQVPLLERIAMTRHIDIPASPTHGRYVLDNINYFAFWYPGANGIKPGWTGNAGLCLVESVRRFGHHLIAVVMNTPNLYTDIRDLFDYGFHDFTWIPSGRTGDTPTQTVSAGTPAVPAVYFPATGHSVQGPMLAYFRIHGGQARLGFPLTEEYWQGGSLIQQFSRVTVLLNGATATTQQASQPDPTALEDPALAPPVPALSALSASVRHRIAPVATTSWQAYVPQTGHSLTWSFWWYYRDHGGATTFGYPETEKIWQNGYLVQYFARALFVFRFGVTVTTGYVEAFAVQHLSVVPTPAPPRPQPTAAVLFVVTPTASLPALPPTSTPLLPVLPTPTATPQRTASPTPVPTGQPTATPTAQRVRGPMAATSARIILK